MSATDPVTAWADDFARAVTIAGGRTGAAPTAKDLARLKALLADKPLAGLACPWWTLVDAVAAWIERVEARPLPALGVAGLLSAAQASPPQRRFAWQDRADA